jgi:type II secretory pathway pseudopilin PulG
MIQLIVVLALLLLLLGLLLPAVSKVRQAAARAQSQNNLKQLGLALHSYHDANLRLPPGVDNGNFSASAQLLPYIEQQALYNTIDFKKDVDHKANAAARATRIRTFESPRDPVEVVNKDYGPTNYLFNDKVFYLNSAATIPGSFPDGTGNTIITGETLKGDGSKVARDVRRQHVLLGKAALKGIKDDAGVAPFKANKNIAADRCASWMDGRFLQGTFNGRLKLNDERPDVSCAGAGGVSTLRSLDSTILVGLGDGSVRSLDATRLTFRTWSNAMDPADGNPLGADW